MAKIKSSIWLPTGKSIIVDLDEFDYLLPNFQVYEIANTSAKDSIKLVIPDADPHSAHLHCWAFDTNTMVSIDWWRCLCREFHQIGAINLYDKYRHCEIGSDVCYGYTDFVVRDKRTKK